MRLVLSMSATPGFVLQKPTGTHTQDAGRVVQMRCEHAKLHGNFRSITLNTRSTIPGFKKRLPGGRCGHAMYNVRKRSPLCSASHRSMHKQSEPDASGTLALYFLTRNPAWLLIRHRRGLRVGGAARLQGELLVSATPVHPRLTPAQ